MSFLLEGDEAAEGEESRRPIFDDESPAFSIPGERAILPLFLLDNDSLKAEIGERTGLFDGDVEFSFATDRVAAEVSGPCPPPPAAAAPAEGDADTGRTKGVTSFFFFF